MANTKKQSLVDALLQSFEETTNFALVKFEKTKHGTLEELRRALKQNDAQLKVVKNTLFEKAINKISDSSQSVTDLRNKAFPIKENTALIMLKGDWSAGLKAFYDFAKKDKTMTFKVGHLDNNVYEMNDLEKIAQLPGKDQLIGQFIGTLKSPLAATTRSLQFNSQKLVYVLSQRGQQSE